MKKPSMFYMLSVFIFAFLLFWGCQETVGPQGPEGSQGVPGTNAEVSITFPTAVLPNETPEEEEQDGESKKGSGKNNSNDKSEPNPCKN